MAAYFNLYRFSILTVLLLALYFVIKRPAGHPSAYLLGGTTNTSHACSSRKCTGMPTCCSILPSTPSPC